MQLLEQIADDLAREALTLQADDQDNTLVNELSETIGALSQTMQEAFLTAVRVRRAENRARRLIASKKKDLALPPPDAAIVTPPPDKAD